MQLPTLPAFRELDIISIGLCAALLYALCRGDHELAVITASALAGALNPASQKGAAIQGL